MEGGNSAEKDIGRYDLHDTAGKAVRQPGRADVAES